MVAVAVHGTAEITRDRLRVALALDPGWASRRDALGHALRLETSGVRADPDELRTAEERFRRARRLLSGDDLTAWLGTRSLTVAGWRRLLGLALLADALADVVPGTEGPRPIPSIDQSTELVVEATLAEICWGVALLDGTLASVLHDQLLGVAACDESGGSSPPPDEGRHSRAVVLAADPGLAFDDPDTEHIAEAVAAVEQAALARVEAADRTRENEVRALLDARRLAWTTVHADRYVFPDVAAAREALACLRIDGASAEELVRRSGVRPVPFECPADRLDATQFPLSSLPLGEAVGPIAGDDGAVVLVLRARCVPPPDELSARARRIATDERLERRLAGRVHHHVHL